MSYITPFVEALTNIRDTIVASQKCRGRGRRWHLPSLRACNISATTHASIAAHSAEMRKCLALCAQARRKEKRPTRHPHSPRPYILYAPAARSGGNVEGLYAPTGAYNPSTFPLKRLACEPGLALCSLSMNRR